MLPIVIISDTHNRHEQLVIPECELLIHAGDFTNRGSLGEVLAVYDWLEDQPAKEIIVVPGNHELGMERNLSYYLSEIKQKHPAIYTLVNEPLTLNGINYYGSPVTPWFYDWAWNVPRGEAIRKYWEAIPSNTNILITHGPPAGVLDTLSNGDSVGCADLSDIVFNNLPELTLHAFGHIHPSSGIKEVNGITFVNAAICDDRNAVKNAPKVIKS